MAQFDQSSLKEFSYKAGEVTLAFSKNEQLNLTQGTAAVSVSASEPIVTEVVSPVAIVQQADPVDASQLADQSSLVAEGEIVESPLVGVVYLSPGPDKPAFISVGDRVKKGQTLLIIEAMKVMNEITAPKDGVVTEILVVNEELADFGKGLVRIKW